MSNHCQPSRSQFTRTSTSTCNRLTCESLAMSCKSILAVMVHSVFIFIHFYLICMILIADMGTDPNLHYVMFKQAMNVDESSNQSCLVTFDKRSDEILEEKKKFLLVETDIYGYQEFKFERYFSTIMDLQWEKLGTIFSPKAHCPTSVHGITTEQKLVLDFLYWNSIIALWSCFLPRLRSFSMLLHCFLLLNSWYSYRISYGPAKLWYAIEVVFFLLIVFYLYSGIPKLKFQPKFTIRMKKVKKTVNKNGNNGKWNDQEEDSSMVEFNANGDDGKIQHPPVMPAPNIVYSPFTQNIHTANIVGPQEPQIPQVPQVHQQIPYCRISEMPRNPHYHAPCNRRQLKGKKLLL